VKSTADLPLASGECSFDVDRSLYDWARKPESLLDVPRIIVLVRIPENALNDRNLIFCLGELVKDGKSFSLREPRAFRIVTEV
jgi:hypothetical protein